MLRLGRISRTFSVEVHDNVDHNKPRKLFKDIYRAYLPEINILTKTEKTETVKRENSALVRRRAQREERMKKLQQPRSIKTSQTLSQQQMSMTLTTPSRKSSIGKRRSLEPTHIHDREQKDGLLYIYKSEMKEIADKELDSLKGRASIRKNRNSLETEQSSPEQFMSKQLTPVQVYLPTKHNHHPVDYTGESSELLGKIFDAGDYQELYDEVNCGLLKRERLYRTRQWKLETKHEWRL